MKRGQSLRPLELLLWIGIFFFSAMLLTLYSGAQNSTHTSQIDIAKTSVGGGRILVGLLEHSVNGTTVLDRIVQNHPQVGEDISRYLDVQEPSITRYVVYRNGEELHETDEEPRDPVTIIANHQSIDIALEYDK